MNNTVKTIAALVVMVGSCAYLAYYYSSQPKPGATIEHLQPLCCAACGKAYEANAGDTPVECKFCSQKTAWRAGVCLKCKKVIPIVKTEHRDAVKCPKCGPTGVREVKPSDIEQAAKP